MGLFNRIINKFTNRASDKIAEKAVNKIFDKGKTSIEKSSNDVDKSSQDEKSLEQKQALANYQQTMILSKMQADMAQSNEVMKYLIFDKDMNVIGVKEDAPDYLKNAFKKV